MKKTNRIFTILIFIFLYIPMAVLIVASFNTGKDITHFDGFTLHRYVELFQDEHLLQLLRNSLVTTLLGPWCELLARAGKSSRMSIFAVKTAGQGGR